MLEGMGKGDVVLDKLSDETITTLLRVAKTNAALRPFFGSPHGMIRLRDEAYRRGIYLTHGDKVEADKTCHRVFEKMAVEDEQ